MRQLHDFLTLINEYLGGSQWFIILLLGTGIFFTIYLKFPQIRYFRHAIRIVKGTYDKKEDKGDTTHFQALTTALSGTVGTGNIAGVALAIHLGGPAALFWMLMTAMFGMTTKFVEVTLSHKYRRFDAHGAVMGGPMYFMEDRLNLTLPSGKRLPTGKWMAVFFALAAVFTTLGTGNLPQINSIAISMYSTFGINRMLTGGILAILLAFVIIGGIHRIAKVTERLVPTMAILYFIGAISVIIYNYENIIPSITSIFSHVLSGTAATGGFLGASFVYTLNRGINRGLFSNEAGQGSAPIAHAAARAHEPVSEGLVAILEPFIDTIIICMITGLTLLCSGVWNEKLPTEFQQTDLLILDQHYDQENPAHTKLLQELLERPNHKGLLTKTLTIKNGRFPDEFTVLHARSIAEEVVVYEDGERYSGELPVEYGKPAINGFIFKGKSLQHGAPLTSEAFKRGFLGNWGQYIVSLGLLLFAFSTSISWSYYGEQAIVYLVGERVSRYYRWIYVLLFFVASFTDTTLIWVFSGITMTVMALPNLLGLLCLHKEVKETIHQYWTTFKKEFPDSPSPE